MSSAINDPKSLIEEHHDENLAKEHAEVPGSSKAFQLDKWSLPLKTDTAEQFVKQIDVSLSRQPNMSITSPSRSQSPPQRTKVVTEIPEDTSSEKESSSYTISTEPKDENPAPNEHNEPQPLPGSIPSSHNAMVRTSDNKALALWWRNFEKGNQGRDKEKRDRVFSPITPMTITAQGNYKTIPQALIACQRMSHRQSRSIASP